MQSVMVQTKRYWAVIPAAGVGRRMGSDIPKQYLPLAGKTVLEQTLSVFIKHPKINGIVLAITEGDPYWQTLSQQFQDISTPIMLASGGQERCHSVLNALIRLATQADADDWVLVHDAARPCLSAEDIDYLINTLSKTSNGGLLGLPMADTVKRCDAQGHVLATVDRSELWRALTPQMFPLALLTKALTHALENKLLVTDEASAMELQGLQVTMLEGQASNIKITHPSDLQMAELFFRH